MPPSEDLYLIAHKVRGEPAFDVAQQMPCPMCEVATAEDNVGDGCVECDGLGYWWIIPTSGHRAYPYWFKDLHDAKFGLTDDALIFDGFTWEDLGDIPPMPPDLPDHYVHKAAPKVSLAEALGIARPTKPQPPIHRRF